MEEPQVVVSDTERPSSSTTSLQANNQTASPIDASQNASGLEISQAISPQVEPEIEIDPIPETEKEEQLEQEDESKPWIAQEHAFLKKQKVRLKSLQARLLNPAQAPISYTTLSTKEKLLHDAVRNFEAQYRELFSQRKKLALRIENEFGIQKFVCTSIRPTLLPYKELLTYSGAAHFVANFFKYEKLEPAHELPTVIPSTTYTTELQSGHSFSLSLALVTLLLGASYNAYIVSGYASSELSLCLPPPFNNDTIPSQLNDPETTTQETAHIEESKYKTKPPQPRTSKYMEKYNKRAIASAPPEVAKEKDAEVDALEGLRIHAWVLVMPGKREIAEPFFIESSTGTIYPVNDTYYKGIESVWNHRNYWVNMQTCEKGLEGMSFDFSNLNKWEALLLDPLSEPTIEMSASWVQPMIITKDAFELRVPLGSRTTYFQGAELDTFADYGRDDGMTARLRKDGEIREAFSNRGDKLVLRIRDEESSKVIQYFAEGRSYGLRKMITINDQMIELSFWSGSRPDGLQQRISANGKIIETFDVREDNMIKRVVTINTEDTSKTVGEDGIIKIKEYFSPSTDDVKTDDIAVKTFAIKDERISIEYHLEPGRLIASTREFRKPNTEVRNSTLTSSSFEVKPFASPMKKPQLYSQFALLQKAEHAAIAAVKNGMREIRDISKSRISEEKEIQLDISVYDTARNKAIEVAKEEKEDIVSKEPQESTSIDYLSPYLLKVKNPLKITRDEAISIRENCLKGFKDRLIEKANILQARHDEETVQYQKSNSAYVATSSDLTVEEKEKYVVNANNTLFKIGVIEKRLQQHKDMAAERYIQLDKKIKADKRLAECW